MTKKEEELLKAQKECDKYKSLFKKEVDEYNSLSKKIETKIQSDLSLKISELGSERIERLLNCSNSLAYEYWGEISDPNNKQFGELNLAATDEEIIKAVELYEKTTYCDNENDN